MSIFGKTASKQIGEHLSRRQRQILDALFERGESSAEEIRAQISSPPSNSAVRATLAIMEERGLVVRKEKGLHYVYAPAIVRKDAQTSAVQRLVQTFFNNSVEQAIVALLGASKERMSAEELDRVRAMIERAKRKG
jgi:predicted transcriptional regulator